MARFTVEKGFFYSFGPAYAASLTDWGQDPLHLDLTKTDDNYEARATQLVRGFRFPIDSVMIDKQLYILEFGTQGLGDRTPELFGRLHYPRIPAASRGAGEDKTGSFYKGILFFPCCCVL